MHFGLVISILMHAAILGWTLFSLQSQREARAPETEAIAVGVVAPSEVAKSRPGAPTAKQLEAEAKETPKAEPAKNPAAKPRPAPAAPPPPEPPAPKEEPKLDPIAKKLAEAPPPPIAPPAVPAPDEQKKLNELLHDLERQAKEKLKAEVAHEQGMVPEKAEAQRKAQQQEAAQDQKKAAEEQKKAEERREAELKRKEAEKKRKQVERRKKLDEEKQRQAEAAKQKQFNADKISALINKAPDKGAPPPSARPLESRGKGPALGAPDGRDQKLSTSEYAMLDGIIGGRLRPCWRLPSAGGGSDTPVVTLRWHLRPDGSLDGDPVVVERARGDALFQLAAEAAIRAVRDCAPFPLPPDKYSVWKTITRDFDPGAMLR